ncbi:MAG: hypothetical protein WBB01_01225 [Phormidesmis sp.]
MKRFILSASVVMLGVSAFAPVAFASGQASTPREVSEDASIHELVLHNREVRNKS